MPYDVTSIPGEEHAQNSDSKLCRRTMHKAKATQIHRRDLGGHNEDKGGNARDSSDDRTRIQVARVPMLLQNLHMNSREVGR